MLADYSTLRPSTSELKAAGITAVGRYIGWDSVPGYNSIGKNLSRTEARALIAAGIGIFLSFEYNPEAATGGVAQGLRDGTLATEQLEALAAPAGMTVYFAVDFDVPDYAPTLADTPANAHAKLGPVAAYFAGIRATKPAYKVAVYGGYWVCKRALDAGLASMAWQTAAWSGGQRDPRAVIYQTGQTTLGAADVDVHETTAADFGQWPRPAAKGAGVTITTPPPGNWKDGGPVIVTGPAPSGVVWKTETTDGEHWTEPVKQ